MTVYDAEGMRFACRISKTRIHTLIICNRATMVTMMYLKVVFKRTLSVLFVKQLLYHFKLHEFRKL